MNDIIKDCEMGGNNFRFTYLNEKKMNKVAHIVDALRIQGIIWITNVSFMKIMKHF